MPKFDIIPTQSRHNDIRSEKSDHLLNSTEAKSPPISSSSDRLDPLGTQRDKDSGGLYFDAAGSDAQMTVFGPKPAWLLKDAEALYMLERELSPQTGGSLQSNFALISHIDGEGDRYSYLVNKTNLTKEIHANKDFFAKEVVHDSEANPAQITEKLIAHPELINSPTRRGAFLGYGVKNSKLFSNDFAGDRTYNNAVRKEMRQAFPGGEGQLMRLALPILLDPEESEKIVAAYADASCALGPFDREDFTSRFMQTVTGKNHSTDFQHDTEIPKLLKRDSDMYAKNCFNEQKTQATVHFMKNRLADNGVLSPQEDGMLHLALALYDHSNTGIVSRVAHLKAAVETGDEPTSHVAQLLLERETRQQELTLREHGDNVEQLDTTIWNAKSKIKNWIQTSLCPPLGEM